MKELLIYVVLICIAAIFVVVNYKKSQGNRKSRRHKRFRESYSEKKKLKKKEVNENLHENGR